MRLDVTVDIPYPREKVFTVYRDRLPELVQYLPNVRAIEVKQRVDEGATTRLLNRWKGGGEIPAVVRKFLSEELLEWDDYATWHADRWLTEWKTVVPAFKEAVKAEGQNRFEAAGDKTRFTISGVIEVDATRVKLVPRILAGTVGPAVEKFIVSAIKPNLLAVADGVRRYLDAQAG